MYCPNCGKPNADGAARCENCLETLPARQGAAPAQESAPPAAPPVYEQPTYQPPAQPAYVQQGHQSPYGADAEVKPSSFLAGNIIMAVLGLCLCVIPMITSVIGIIFGAQVSTKFGVGDIAGARSSSKVAKVLFFVSLGLSIVSIVLGIIYISAVVVALEEFGDLSQYMY